MTARLRSILSLCVVAVFGMLLTAAPVWALENPQEHVSDKALFQINGVPFLTKFMILELVAAGLLLWIFIPLARRLRSGELARGPWQNFWETILFFVRDEIAKPTIGEHDADKYCPFLWTIFLFILFSNLLGMVPGLGSPTASLWVTGGLAVVALIAVYAAAVSHLGFVHFVKNQLWPPIDIPPLFGFGYLIKALIAFIEFIGLWIKSAVLALRLFANMFAGHMVLVIVLSFSVVALDFGPAIWTTVSLTSVAGVIALSFLELFVACLQAYVFVFLTSLFIGMAIHPH